MFFKFSTIIAMLALIGWNNMAKAQNLAWAKQLEGSGSQGYATTVDAAGNVYTTGSFIGTVDFDPNAATFNLTSVGQSDIFVSKLDVNGNFVWAKRMGSTSYDDAYSIAVDTAGNVYTTGNFYDTADFDPSAATFNLTSAGGSEIFVSKLDANGNFVWAKQMGGTIYDQANSIALDAAGNVYTTGSFYDTADFDPNAGTFNLTSVGSNDIFISKLDANGNFVWAKQMGGTSIDQPKSIALDAAGNVYTTGYFIDTTDFDPSAATFNLTSAGGYDVFISKLDANGNFVWAKQMGGTSSVEGLSIALDAAGNIYTTGSFYGTADFDPNAGTFNLTSVGSNDIFISKLDANGNFVWAKQMGGTDADQGLSITLDAAGNVYTTGSFKATADFDPNAGTFNLTSVGSNDIFISKLAANGNFVWAKQIGGTDADQGLSITLDAAGNIYTTGYFNSIVDFDPNAGTFNLTTTISNTFILKLCNAVTPAFAAVAPICAGATLAALPTTSTNNIAGTWSPALNNTATTTYTFTASAGQCADMTTLIITVNLFPNVATSISGNTISATENNATYQWLDCNNNNVAITGATSQNFVATTSGNYAVIVSNGDCQDTSACVDVVITGLINAELANNISIYPNPYTQEVFLELADFANTTVEIYSVNGQLLHSLNLVANKTALSIENLSSGMYLVKIINAAGISVKKLMKSN